jgi:Ca2+-binding RTX toxin-like protein
MAIIRGTDGDDVKNGTEAGDLMNGFGGDDVLHGQGGNDNINGDAGNDRLFGDPGNDLLDGGLQEGDDSDLLDGGDGTDTASYSQVQGGVDVDLAQGVAQGGGNLDELVSIENLTGTNFADKLVGNSVANLIQGADGADQISGGGGADWLSGNGDDDTVKGAAGNDRITGGRGADVLDGGSDTDTLDYTGSQGGVFVNLADNAAGALINIGDDPALSDATGDTISGFENVTGSAKSDGLIGGDGANKLSGGGGADGLQGGLGRDELTGGGGADQFFYGSTAESGVMAATRDLVRDFRHADGDRLVLNIDTDPDQPGEQQLSFVGQGGFTAAGQARFFFEGDHTVVAVNTVGTSGAEMQIQLDGHVGLVASDFIFGV